MRVLLLVAIWLVLAFIPWFLARLSMRRQVGAVERRLDRAEALIDRIQQDAVEHSQLGGDITFTTIVLDEIRQYEDNKRKELR